MSKKMSNAKIVATLKTLIDGQKLQGEMIEFMADELEKKGILPKTKRYLDADDVKSERRH